MQQHNDIIPKDVLASKGTRLANFILDYIAIIILAGVVGAILGVFSELTGNYTIIDLLDNKIIEYAFGYLVWLMYYIPLETFTEGRTLSKFITKSKVVTYDGKPPSFQDVVIRSLCRLIPFEQFSFLGTDGKGWHDSISNTYVINAEKYEAQLRTKQNLEEIGQIGA